MKLTSLLFISSLASGCVSGSYYDTDLVQAKGRVKYDSKCVEQEDRGNMLKYSLEDSARVYYVDTEETERTPNLEVFHNYLDKCPFIPHGQFVYIEGTINSDNKISDNKIVNAVFIHEFAYRGD